MNMQMERTREVSTWLKAAPKGSGCQAWRPEESSEKQGLLTPPSGMVKGSPIWHGQVLPNQQSLLAQD